MSKRKIRADFSKRYPTRHRGISYRIRKDGSRTYSVYHRRRYFLVEGGEHEARTLQADLVRKAARGEQTIVPSKVTFAGVAEEWFESKHRLRPWTRKAYRAALDNVLLPGSAQ